MPEHDIHGQPHPAWSNRIEDLVHAAGPKKEAGQDAFHLDQMSPNVLPIYNARLQEIAHAVQDEGLTMDELVEAVEAIEDDDVFADFLTSTMERVENRIEELGPHEAADMDSCAAGALLAYALIQEALPQPVVMSPGAVQVATEYQEQHYDNLLETLTAVLRSQQAVQLAFENALGGLQGEIDAASARVGAGATVLGKLAAVEFTGDAMSGPN